MGVWGQGYNELLLANLSALLVRKCDHSSEDTEDTFEI